MNKFLRFIALSDVALRNCFRSLLWAVAAGSRRLLRSTVAGAHSLYSSAQTLSDYFQRKASRRSKPILTAASARSFTPFLLTLARAPAALVIVGLSSSVVLATMAPPTQTVAERFARVDWGDEVQTWNSEVEVFALRITQGYGIRHDVAMEFSPWILEAAKRQQLEPELLAGLVITESSFRKNVTSSVGAIGPAQVRPELWSQFCGTGELSDPAENIYCGAQILAYYKDRCGAEDCALQAYNIGPYSRKVKAGQRYVTKVGRWRDALVNIRL